MSESSPEPASRRKRLLIAMAGVAAALLAALALLDTLRVDDSCDSPPLGASIGGPVELVDSQGRLRRFPADGPALLYFGYTYCPDVCPIDVARMSEAVALLDEQGFRLTPIFVTIDPGRDTPAELRDYASSFHPRLVALTGSRAQISEATKTWRVYYARGEGEAENYLMDHSTFTYLVDPKGAYVTHFSRAESAGSMSEEVACQARERQLFS